MRYIRTKDGRIVKHPHPNAEVFTFRYEILEQADTIEELCDEFVYHLKSGGKFIDEQLVKSDIYEIVYGAIWTDKGLIYVAKMNDKGELELLWNIQ